MSPALHDGSHQVVFTYAGCLDDIVVAESEGVKGDVLELKSIPV
jgi:hypothetical protein